MYQACGTLFVLLSCAYLSGMGWRWNQHWQDSAVVAQLSIDRHSSSSSRLLWLVLCNPPGSIQLPLDHHDEQYVPSSVGQVLLHDPLTQVHSRSRRNHITVPGMLHCSCLVASSAAITFAAAILFYLICHQICHISDWRDRQPSWL
jgi:hypothetical protein